MSNKITQDAAEDEMARQFFSEPVEYQKGTQEMYKDDSCLPVGFNLFVEGRKQLNSGMNWVCRSKLTTKNEKKNWYKPTFIPQRWDQAYRIDPDWGDVLRTKGKILIDLC